MRSVLQKHGSPCSTGSCVAIRYRRGRRAGMIPMTGEEWGTAGRGRANTNKETGADHYEAGGPGETKAFAPRGIYYHRFAKKLQISIYRRQFYIRIVNAPNPSQASHLPHSLGFSEVCEQLRFPQRFSKLPDRILLDVQSLVARHGFDISPVLCDESVQVTAFTA